MGEVNVDNLETILSQKQREKYDDIVSIFNSDKTVDERFKLLRRKSKKSLRKALNLVDMSRKIFTIKTIDSEEERVFNLEEFDCKNNDYIDKVNLIRIILNLGPRLNALDRKKGILWFEALTICLTRKILPLYKSNRDKVNVDFYMLYTVNNLRDIIERNIENPLDIWRNEEFLLKRSVSHKSLIALYNLRNPNTPRNTNNISFNEIQRALGIQNPIKIDTDGLDKDIIIYYMMATGDDDIRLGDIGAQAIYKALGYTPKPQSIKNLFRMDHLGETLSFKRKKKYIREYLKTNWRDIPTTIGNKNFTFPLGIARKIKYFYINKNIKDLYPTDLSHTSDLDELQLALNVVKE